MSKRILVVEDQEDNRQILRDLLGSAGYQMTEAWDGECTGCGETLRPKQGACRVFCSYGSVPCPPV